MRRFAVLPGGKSALPGADRPVPAWEAQQDPAPERVRIGILDDIRGRFELILRIGAKALTPPMDIDVRHWYTLGEAIAKAPLFDPDLVFVDLGGTFPQLSRDWSEPIAGILSLPILRGLIAPTNPTVKFFVVSRLCEDRIVGPLAQLGVHGYLQIDEIQKGTPGYFAGAVRTVLGGGTFFGPQATAAHDRWNDRAAPIQPTKQPVVLPLRPDRELYEEEAYKIGRYLLYQMRDELSAALPAPATRCDFLWRQHLTAGREVEMFTYDITPGYVAVGTARGVAPPPIALTERRKQVLSDVAAGLSRRDVAMRQGISPRTVDAHVTQTADQLAKVFPALLSRRLSPTEVANLALGRGALEIRGAEINILPRPGTRAPSPAAVHSQLRRAA